MVVQHNLQAANTNRMLGANVKAVSKSTEKLSSGYQVNRAADDAAGLSISEKMRNQIRGINQAVKNSEDGVSLIQTAEGNMSEIHSILQRMGELATKLTEQTLKSLTVRQSRMRSVSLLRRLILSLQRQLSTAQSF